MDADARPIRRGNPAKPTEFCYKARVADTAEGFVIADVPARSNPNDDTLLERAIGKAKAAGMQVRSGLRRPRLRHHRRRRRAAAAARQRLRHPSPRPRCLLEATRGWRRRYRFRNGLEGRISQLKRKGLRRTRLRTLAGAQTWVGGIALAHNLQRMAFLA